MSSQEVVEKLNTIRDHLRAGVVGQREVWEEWLTEAIAEIERRLTAEEAYMQIVEGWLREWRGIHFPEGAIDDLCQRIAEQKP